MSLSNLKTPGSNRLSARYADFIVKWRWAAIAVSVILVAIVGSGVRWIEMGNNYRLFFSSDNPELMAFEDFQDTYTKNDNILFVVQPENPKEGQVFTQDVAAAIHQLTEEAWQLPYVIRVDSITNFQHTWANEDDLTVEDLIKEGDETNQLLLDERRVIALAEPLLKNNVISHDADTTGVNVIFQYPEKSITEVPEAATAARELVARIHENHSGLRIALTGVSMLNASFAEASMKDMSLMGLMFVMIIVVAALSLKQLWGTVVTIFVIVLSMMAGMGSSGWANIKITPISMTAPIVIITIAIADSIHILVSMRKAQAAGMVQLEALKESLRINLVPVSITSLTTIVGFLALNFSETPPFKHLGNLTAVGIGAAWMLSLTFLPAVMSLLPVRAPKGAALAARSGNLTAGPLLSWSNFIIGNRNIVLGVAGIAAITFGALAPTVELNDEWVKYFDKRIPFRNDAEFGEKNLAGMYSIEYSVESGEEGGISEPEYLSNLEAFTEWLRTQEEVDHVFSFSDIIKRLNRNMNGDDTEFYAIPENRELAAQYTLLYEISLPYGLDLNDRVAIDKSATRVTATLPEISALQGFSWQLSNGKRSNFAQKNMIRMR
ncbi:MAG: putative RND superfamily exporter protein [Verrucomicrobiales bacterium]|jgi:predicted RND superfamily exporter protein